MGSDLSAAREQVRVLILTGFGLNCEQETAHAFAMCGSKPELVHLSDMLSAHGGHTLQGFDILAMIGGFSFGDHIGAGVVYANRMRYRLRAQLDEFIAKGGLTLGICNGFQTMVRLGLVPGFDGDYHTQRATLAANDRLGYRDAWVTLAIEPDSPCVWTRGIDRIDLPARHGEGKFLMQSPELAQRLEQMHLVGCRYVDPEGKPTQRWPYNPNGSPNAIAGVCDPTGRVFGLMPHPDAYLYGVNHPQWQRQRQAGTLEERGQGLRIFQNGVDYVARRIASR